MGHTITFDTLAYAKKLKAAGVPEQQAEVQAEAIAEIIEERLASKHDIEELRTDLKRDIAEMSYKLTIRMGSMLVIAVGVLTAIIKL